MGLRCLSLDPSAFSPAAQIAPGVRGELDDPSTLAGFLEQCKRVTLENEFIPAGSLREACRLVRVDEANILPGIDTLATIQDKLLQRQAYARAGVPSPRAWALEGSDGAWSGEPLVLKARFGGYDGKGTRYARSQEEFESHRDLWQGGGWLAEDYVPFRRELAVMVYRDSRGAGCFPTMETVQENHVCSLVYPADTDASEVALAAVEAVDGYGLFGVELFELEDGALMVNEIAPRPHNTGHYTLDWGGVSQFEQHVRLVLGLPPAEPSGGPACMANLLGQPGAGDFRPGLRAALEIPGVHVHWYGKVESRPGRKMGHLTAVGGADVIERAVRARDAFYGAWPAVDDCWA